MSEPFLSEIKLVSFNFPPKGWAFCNGQLLPINQNQALFSLMGTIYGGNGQTNFALPNLRGRLPVHVGAGHTQGEAAGSSAVTVNIQQLPTHTHFVMASGNSGGATPSPNNNYLAPVNGGYGPLQAATSLSPQSLTATGGSQPHTNMMPYLVLNFVVALQGIFPSQN